MQKSLAKRSNLSVGKRGEEIAVSFLKKQGRKVLDTNVYTRWGEIDIIAKDHNDLVFVEVKTRYGTKCGYPEESINYYKMKSLERAISWYLTKKHLNPEIYYRIDVVSVILDTNDQLRDIKLFQNITAD